MTTSAAPVIGITTYGPETSGDLPSFSRPRAYVEAVEGAGGAALLLAASSAPPETLLDRLDGLILAGGGDIDPATHGGGQHPAVYMVNPVRDRFELGLVRAALARRELPVLGICRGVQLLNIALGGDLDLHLPDVYGERVVHRLPPREPTTHDVRVQAGSVLEEIYGILEFPVCSWHHQAVRKLGAGLRAIAEAPDGVVEALVYDEHPFAIGVQWHPEMQVEDDPLQRRLFRALVERGAASR